MSEWKAYAVWDASTRWFHWINLICVVALSAVGLAMIHAGDLGVGTPGKVTLKSVHAWVGYVFALNLLWRFVWAFLGNRYARWRSFLPGGKGYLHAIRSYVAAFIAGHPEQYVGHNPIGRLGISALFLLIAVLALTGLLLAGTDLFYPPFGPWIARWVAAPGVDPSSLMPYSPEMYDAAAYQDMRAFRRPFVLAHLYGFYALAVAVVLHVVGVVVTEVKEEGSLISAMFTGRKLLRERPVDDGRGEQG